MNRPGKRIGADASAHARSLLGVQDLAREEVDHLLARSAQYLHGLRNGAQFNPCLHGLTQINLFHEVSTRTRISFEFAGKNLGAKVINITVADSSIKKGESIVDTAATLNAMHPDILVMRHHAAGAVQLLAQEMGCAVINGGDGAHEHPTQALLDAATICRHRGMIEGLVIALCGDILHSRVARSNMLLLGMLGARVRLIAPASLIPADAEKMGAEIFHEMAQGLSGADVVMMLRLQSERMTGNFVPSQAEYFHFFGLDRDKLRHAKDDALVLHPGPINRGTEISPDIADGPQSRIREQVETGIATRMAVLEFLHFGAISETVVAA